MSASDQGWRCGAPAAREGGRRFDSRIWEKDISPLSREVEAAEDGGGAPLLVLPFGEGGAGAGLALGEGVGREEEAEVEGCGCGWEGRRWRFWGREAGGGIFCLSRSSWALREGSGERVSFSKGSSGSWVSEGRLVPFTGVKPLERGAEVLGPAAAAEEGGGLPRAMARMSSPSADRSSGLDGGGWRDGGG